MHTNDILRAALIGFDEQRAKITAQIRDINVQLAHSEVDRGPQHGPLAPAGDNANPITIRQVGGSVAKHHTMSAEGRARIAAAQRKRWKLAKKAKAAAA